MSKRNDRAIATTTTTTTTPPATTPATDNAEAKTLEQLLAEAKAKQAEADEARKKAEEAVAKAEEARQRAEEEARKAKQAEKEAREKAIAEAKAKGKYREAYLPTKADGTLGRPYASPFLAEQASPIGKAEKRLCWGDITGPIGDPLTPDEMAALF